MRPGFAECPPPSAFGTWLLWPAGQFYDSHLGLLFLFARVSAGDKGERGFLVLFLSLQNHAQTARLPKNLWECPKLSMNIFYAFLFFIPSLDPKGNHCLKTVLKNPHWPSVTSTLFIRLFVEKSLNPVKITVSPKNVTLQADSREATETINPPERWLFWKTPNPCWLFPSVTSFLVSIIYQSKLVPFWAHRGDEVSEWIKLKYHSHPFQWHPTTLFL